MSEYDDQTREAVACAECLSQGTYAPDIVGEADMICTKCGNLAKWSDFEYDPNTQTLAFFDSVLYVVTRSRGWRRTYL